MKKVCKAVLWILGVYIAINAVIYTDVYLRARASYLKGMMYLDWIKNPLKKKAYWDRWLEKEKLKISKKKGEEKRVLETALKMRYKWQMAESDAKNAYYWFKTTVECFQPPRSKYVRLAEKKMKIAEKLWKNKMKNER
ncbi:MAG: hypothetical protein J7L54_04420 [Elusimicrobia bacterium]|nr:hypothetical protein [Elusimicrobiota bacterium]